MSVPSLHTESTDSVVRPLQINVDPPSLEFVIHISVLHYSDHTMNIITAISVLQAMESVLRSIESGDEEEIRAALTRFNEEVIKAPHVHVIECRRTTL